MRTLGGFPNPPAMGSDEHSSSTPDAIYWDWVMSQKLPLIASNDRTPQDALK
jgi:hypothetical protein